MEVFYVIYSFKVQIFFEINRAETVHLQQKQENFR